MLVIKCGYNRESVALQAVLAAQAAAPNDIPAWCRSKTGWAAAVAALSAMEDAPKQPSAILDAVLGTIRAIYAEHLLAATAAAAAASDGGGGTC